MRAARLLPWLCFPLWACAIHLEAASANAKISCGVCPEGWTCNKNTSLCIEGGSDDGKGPVLTLVTAQDAQTVALTFDKALDETAAQDLSHYAIVGPTGPLAVSSVNVSHQSVQLNTDLQLPQRTYTLTVTAMKDSFDNPSDASGTFAGYGAVDGEPPAQLSPTDGATVDVVSDPTLADAAGVAATHADVLLVWTPVAGAGSYSVQIATDPDFTDPVTLASTTSQLAFSNALPTTYWWRVRSDVTTAPFDSAYPMSAFNGLGGTIYVFCSATTTLCADAGRAGNLKLPYQTITGGIGAANALGRRTVNVANRAPSGPPYSESLSLIDGVNVFGAFVDFAQARDLTQLTPVAAAGATLVQAIDINAPTTLDGFDISGTTTTQPTAIGMNVANANENLVLANLHVTAPLGEMNSTGLVIVGTGEDPAHSPIIRDSQFIGGPSNTPSKLGNSRSTGVQIESSSPTFEHNLLMSGVVDPTMTGSPYTSRCSSYGVSATDSQPILDRNTIIATDMVFSVTPPPAGPTPATSSLIISIGVLLNDPGGILTNNVIRAGAAWEVNGVRTGDSTPTVTILSNNTIFAAAQLPSVPATGNSQVAMKVAGPTVLANNALVTNGGVSACGISTNSSSVLFLANNVFAGFWTAFSDGTIAQPSNVASMQSYLGTLAASGDQGMTVAQALFTDAAAYDFTLQDTSPLIGAGIDTSATTCAKSGTQSCGDVTVNRDGVARTPTYSVGAY